MILHVACLPLGSLFRSWRDLPFVVLFLSTSLSCPVSIFTPRSIFLGGPKCVFNVSFARLPRLPRALPPIARTFSLGNVSLDPTDAASPRYDSAATLSPWHPLGLVGEPSSLVDARCHRRCPGAPTRRYSWLPPPRSIVRSLGPSTALRSPCARLVRGLSPDEHNFDPLGGDTHRWTTWNPPKYAAQRARPFARHYHTHASTRRGRSADRIAEAGALEGEREEPYTRYVSPPHGPTKRNA